MRSLILIICLALIGWFAYRYVIVPDRTNIPSDSNNQTPSDEQPDDVSVDKDDEDLVYEATSDSGKLLLIEFPHPNEKISSPLVVKGQARGTWFFEASFPIVLTNWDGLIIGQGIAMTAENWMTTEYVSFEATIEFEKPEYGENGFLILQKDNPSGLPEHDDAVEIPILFE